MKIEPYLFFEGRADEAIEFYKVALGAKVGMLMRYKDCPESARQISPALADKVMHCGLRVGDTNLSISDGHCQNPPNFTGIALTLAVTTDAEARQRFTALGDGGKITMPLGKTFFSSSFGMLSDRFGVQWMIIMQD